MKEELTGPLLKLQESLSDKEATCLVTINGNKMRKNFKVMQASLDF